VYFIAVWQYEVEPQATELVCADDIDSSDIDIIQSALQQSSLSLEDSSDTTDTLDFSDATLSFLISMR